MKHPEHSLLTLGKCRLQLHSEVHEKCKLQLLPHSQFLGSKCSENTVWLHRKDKGQGAFAHHLQTVGTSKGKKTFSMGRNNKSMIYSVSNELRSLWAALQKRKLLKTQENVHSLIHLERERERENPTQALCPG